MEGSAEPKPSDLLSPEDFTFHYENLKYAHERRKTYLCYHLERLDGDRRVLLDSAVIQNQGSRHVEECFLFSENVLEKLKAPGSYSVTWYLSWSPCARCAQAVIRFLQQHPNVRLRILVARLYFHETRANRAALRALRRREAPIEIMSPEDFAYCWKHFVDHRGEDFQPWEDMDANVDRLAEELSGIWLSK
ncbi:single-stranded DNA cytosine deaminase-like [Dasypus novemcinctus]|uniref:single-stranded DNA cytosine deaminase-like n=1 Tax=Dasypus novemcinctus TaxID=9361 RepID=UPI00265F9EF7|nr:DNA dC->dU-editing enzyme APOBEC3-like [Dasypus novemcinctus]